jgi:hypothetical protein
MSYAELVDLLYDALSAHPSEIDAYEDIEYVSEEAAKCGFSVRQITDAFEEASSL